MFRNRLRREILSAQGGRSFTLLLERIDKEMTEEEARQWCILLSNIESDLRSQAEHRAKRLMFRGGV
jgi:hypothetical protein